MGVSLSQTRRVRKTIQRCKSYSIRTHLCNFYFYRRLQVNYRRNMHFTVNRNV